MTKIEWATDTWNPITGCTPISEGCANCYAKRMATRLRGRFGYPADDPFQPGTFHPDKIDISLFPAGKSVFVCSMGDFFHEKVTREQKEDVYQCINNQHPDNTFFFLTKRPQNVMSYWIGEQKNVWLGVTAENQETADARIPVLLQIPAAVRFVSAEPMLGPVDLRIVPCRACNHPGNILEWPCPYCNGSRFVLPDWIICGAETGPGARRMELEWARDLRDQCKAAGVPFFFKKATGKLIPDDLMIREFPKGE